MILCVNTEAESIDYDHIPELLELGGLFHFRKSREAAVGELVDMLNKAPPLHQDFTPGDLSQESWSNNARETFLLTPTPASSMSSGLAPARKTTTDALEEFQAYKEMKNTLLMRSSESHI